MKLFRNLMVLAFYAFCTFFVFNGAATAQASDAQMFGFDRWIGSIEGEKDITPGGAAWLYDLHVVDENTMRIEKSVAHSVIKQTFPITKIDKGIQFGNAENSAIPEFNNIVLLQNGERQLQTTLFGTENITLRPSIKSYALLQWAFLFLLVLIGNELTRRYKYFNHFLWIAVPILLTPLLWVHSGYDDWFRWVKLYSTLAGSIIFMAFRFHGLNKFEAAKYAVAGILAINIFEACTKDFSTGMTLNIINGIAGLLLIATICRIATIKRDENAPHDMLWTGMTIFWILAYDIWNVTFSYMNLSNTVFNTLAILTAPTLAALFIKRGTWLQARANTLSIYMMYLFTTAFLYNDIWSVSTVLPVPRSEPLSYFLVAASFVTNAALFIFYYRWKFTGKAPKNLQIGQSESVI